MAQNTSHTMMVLQNFIVELAQMVEQQTVEPEALGSNPAAGEFYCTMLQRSTSDRVYKIPSKQTYDRISVYMVSQVM